LPELAFHKQKLKWPYGTVRPQEKSSTTVQSAE